MTSGVIKWTGAAKECTTINNDGSVLSFGYGGGYGSQIWMDDGSGEGGMYIRNVKAVASGAPSEWHSWRKVLTSGNFASVLDDVYLKDTTDTMYGTLTIDGKNKSNQATTNNLIINGNNGAGGWIVRRSSADTESVKLTVNDSQAIFQYNNDEAASQFRFVLKNTDTESSNGTNASEHAVTFDANKSGTTISATNFSGASGVFTNAYSQNYVLRNSGNAEIGSFKNQTTGTTTAVGDAYVTIGNGTAEGKANNARGRIFMYSASSGYVQILPGTSSTYNMTLYLPGPSSNAAETGQFVFHANDTQVGSSTKPVYIASNGKATAVGTIAVSCGGTGLTAAPSLQVNLASTSAASIFTASPRPGVTGVLGVANGGTGSGTHTTNRIVWYNGSTMTAGYHYADQTHIGVGYTASTAPSYTLYVGDQNSSAGTFGVKKSITIADKVTMQYDSTNEYMYFTFA
jgi:hypothetical protein